MGMTNEQGYRHIEDTKFKRQVALKEIEETGKTDMLKASIESYEKELTRI